MYERIVEKLDDLQSDLELIKDKVGITDDYELDEDEDGSDTAESDDKLEY